jgi:hypothetical protein
MKKECGKNCEVFILRFNIFDSGFYKGIGVHLVRSVPNTAIMFVTYELVSRWLEN